MQCAICFFGINHEKGGYLIARDIFLVGAPAASNDSPLRAVHLLCWYIRQLVRVTTPLPLPPDAPKLLEPNVPGASGVRPICHACKHPVDVHIEPDVRLLGCAAGPMHIACLCLLYNARRQLLCSHRACGGSKARLDAHVDEWSRIVLPQGFVNEVLPHAAPRIDISPVLREDLRAEGILGALSRREKWNLLIGAFAPETPVKALSRALVAHREEVEERAAEVEADAAGTRRRGGPRLGKHYRSPLQYMENCSYTATEMVRMGLGFDMLFSHPGDWTIILNHDIFEPHALMHPGLGANFMRLLLAGMDLQRFVDARYTLEDLKTLRFNLPSFRAAGGTPEQLETLLETRLDPNDFGNPATAWLLGRRDVNG